MGREGGEAHPAALLRSEGVFEGAVRCRGRIGEREAQPPEDVAIAQHGMAQGFHAAAARADEAAFFGAALVDVGRRDAVQPHREAEGLRAQHVVDVGHGIHPEAPGLGRQLPHAPQRVVHPLRVDLQKVDRKPLEEGIEEPPRRHRDLQIGAGRAQRPQSVGQHRHVAHGRGAQHQQMARQRAVTFSAHRARDSATGRCTSSSACRSSCTCVPPRYPRSAPR